MALLELAARNSTDLTLYALIVFYFRLAGKTWGQNENWLERESVCDWSGISCDEGGILVELQLQNNRLTGRLPSEIGLLTSLSKYDLDRLSQSIVPLCLEFRSLILNFSQPRPVGKF